jgi:hypothetical protein
MSIHVISLVLKRQITPASHKLVAIKLADCASDDGSRVFPALATVAAEAGVSIDTARRAITDLKKIGVLRLIKQGGSGPRSTNEFAFDMDALWALPKVQAEAPEAEVAEAEYDVDQDVDAPAKGSTGATLSAENKGSKLLPLDPDKGSTQNAKGGTGATQTVKNLDKPPLSPTAVGEIEFVDFEEFETIWPWYGDERRDTARSAWAELDEINRRAATEHASRYLADLKAGKGRRKKSRMQAAGYLRSEIWKNRKASIARVRRQAVVVRGTDAWDWASVRRRQVHGIGMVSTMARPETNPQSGAAEKCARVSASWFEGDDVPAEVADGKGRDWWIVETALAGAA